MKNKKRKSNEKQILDQLKKASTILKDGIFFFTGPMTINEFAQHTKQPVNVIIQYFFKKGKMYNLNHTLDEEKIAELCLEFNLDFQKKPKITEENFIDKIHIKDKAKDLKPRPPIVTIMGHVNHGKTTLIDTIKKTNITAKESGGITQHTGAYQVDYKNKKITFFDTPGHESFAEMRARGANATDIVVLVVAADDGVMPQTKEAIEHAKHAKVPIIVFINKIDKGSGDLEKIRAELSKHDVVTEEWRGDTQFIYGSALKNKGIDKLFEAILLQAELLDLKANPNRKAMGVVIESKLDKGLGAVTTLLITNGSLMKKDFIVAGANFGRIRLMLNSDKKAIESAGPSMPVIVSGLNYTPEPGDKFLGFEDEKLAKNLANKKRAMNKEKALRNRGILSEENGFKILNVIIKSDVLGTAEAIKNSLSYIKNSEIKIKVISAGVGQVSKSDVFLAQTAKGVIFAFNTKPSKTILSFANQNNVQIVFHTVIYEIIKHAKKMIKGMLTPKYEYQLVGKAKILKVIPISTIGNIAGSVVTSGKAVAKSKIKVYRNGKLIHEGKLDSLKREKNAVNEVEKGNEFGCHILRFNDIKEDDVLEFYQKVEIKQ